VGTIPRVPPICRGAGDVSVGNRRLAAVRWVCAVPVHPRSALRRYLDGVSEEEITELNIPTGAELRVFSVVAAPPLLCVCVAEARVGPVCGTWAASPVCVVVFALPPPPLSTAVPLVYELDADLKPVRHYYLGNAEEIAARIAAVASQATVKK
jgi:hypothetical protein